jgi:hypothetical protein
MRQIPMENTTSFPPRRITTLRPLRLVLLGVACVLLTGCFETKQDIILNPDGSGKMVVESVFAQMPALVRTDSAALPNEGLTNFIRKTLEETAGVEAWRDISFHQRADGRAYFRGTAYFGDLSKLQIGSMLVHRYSVTRDETGNLIISLNTSASIDSPLQKITEPVTAESIQRERAMVRSALPLLQSTLGAMKQDTTLHFSGALKRSSNFEVKPPSLLHLLTDGGKIIQAIEQFVFDTNLDQVRISGQKSSFEDLMNERLYGERAPVLAVIKPGTKPLFDYAKEVAEARQAFPEFARKLQTEAGMEISKPTVDGQPATLTVTGIEWFNGELPTRSHSSFGDRRRSYILHLRAGLSGIVLRVNKVQFTRAKTLEGLDLLRPNGNSDLGASPSVGTDPSMVFFRAGLQMPPLDTKGLAELSGVLECDSMASQRTVELISGRLRAGTKGAEFETQIDGYDPRMSGYDRLSLRTRLEPGQLRSIHIVGDAGQRSQLQQRGHTVIGDMHIITYITRNEIPSTGKIVAEVLTGEQTLRIPFALTNVTLLGQSLR